MSQCKVNEWYPIRTEIFDIAWNIDSPDGKVSIALAINRDLQINGIRYWEVSLDNGLFGGLHPVLGKLRSMEEAERYAKAFMSDICTWKDLERFFRGNNLFDVWKMLGV